MDEFFMPNNPDELWSSDFDGSFKVENLVDYEDKPQQLGEAAESIAFVLCDQDPLSVVEQQNFDQLCSIVRCFHLLDPSKRRQLLDALCSSLTCLNAWIDRLLGAPADTVEKDSVTQHRSAFKAYLFFLHWTSIQAAREARDSVHTTNSASMTSGATKGRGRKKAGADFSDDWDWSSQFPKVMKAVSQSLNTDLWALFRPNRPDEHVLIKLIQLSVAALENPAAAKNEELAAGAAHVLAVCALRYQQLEAVASALVDLLNKYEHTPPIVAELLRYSVAQWDDGRLAATVLRDVAAVDPTEYERQQNATGEKAGVRSVAEFVQEMANRMPRLMANQISLLLPHLGGKAWTLRSGIVLSIGYLLHKAFDSATTQEAADAQGVAARLRSKQHLLDVLCERIRDQSSYTRKAVLQTWQYLAENRAVPLGHWQVVTEIATGRLEDKSSLVRKEALRLLQALMLHNPFGPQLPIDRFAASLATHKTMLDAVQPPSATENAEADAIEENIQVENGEEGEATEVVVKPEPEGDDVDMDAAVEAEEETTPAEEETAAAVVEGPPAKTCAEVGWDGTVEELQALVASLELAVDFARSLTNCMPVLTQLLASSTVSDVQESIAMLLTCKQFCVAGAPEAIRKMLPLVFSKDQAVKDRIIEALDQLYVTGWAGNNFTSAQAARNLVSLASGATLGELGALEEVVKEFVFKNFVTPVMLHELWEIASTAYAAVHDGAQGAGRALRDLRASFAVLSFAAAYLPQAFSERHIDMLLKYGLGDARFSDALTARHACSAMVRLADNFEAGLYDGVKDQVYAGLVRTLIASPLPEDSWYSAAEAAITATYTLHPTPELVCAAVLRRLAARASLDTVPTEEDAMDVDGMDCDDEAGEDGNKKSEVETLALSRLFFVLGQVSLQHLVYVERLTKAVRRQRNDAEKKAAEDKAQRAAKRTASDDDDEDINAELGVGSVAADAELDAVKDACEAQILGPDSLLGPYARLVSAVCHSRSVLTGDARLRSSALLSLCKLMTVDPRFCDANLQLIFTLLQNRSVEAPLRCNLIVALGDLALRFPNHLEPWTEHVYRPLGDPDTAVRKNSLMVLTHLILNDMMKVKGHIAKMAICLEDEDSRISALAQLFFHELAKKEYKGTSPIYNLLPDILSNLSKDTTLGRGKFQSVMQQLLGYIKKDKQGDALVDKLCQRMASTEDRIQWRNVAFCLSQLPLSEKGLKHLAEGFKLYKQSLADEEVLESIKSILAKAKKSSAKPDVKTLVEELEVKIEEAAAERAEEEATAEAARRRAAKDRGELVEEEEEDAAPAVVEKAAVASAVVEDAMESGNEDDVEMSLVREESVVAAESVAMIKPDPEAEEEVSTGAVVEEEQEEEEQPKKPVARRGRRAAAASTTSSAAETNDDPEEETASRPTRSRASTRTAATKTKVSEPVTRRTTRRTKTAAAAGSDDEGEERIAAIQAGMGAINIKQEDC